jgi:SAM-dependent methyltransferase
LTKTAYFTRAERTSVALGGDRSRAALGRTMTQAKFDAHAENYHDDHARSLSSSGEDPEYFHRYKLGCIERLGLSNSARILDYGCGIGNVTVHLARQFDTVHGFDPSRRSLDMCKERVPSAILHETEQALPEGYFDAAVLSGVLHHIKPADRKTLLRHVYRTLRPGGRVIVFEHNPINPLTRKVVRDCPFDDDAILLWPWEIPQLLINSGFYAPKLDYIVFFPKMLAALRPLEPRMRGLFIGAQTMTVARV